MIFAHAFIGQILAYFLASKLLVDSEKAIFNIKLTKRRQTFFLWLISMLASILPDVDILYILFVNPYVSHRTLLTHSLIPYLILVWLIAILVKYKKLHKFIISISAAFLVGIATHLLADMFVEEVVPFSPIYNMHYKLALLPIIKSEGFMGYFKSPYILIELALICTGTTLLINTFQNFKKELKLLLGVSGIILVLAVIMILPFLTNFN